MDEMLSSMELWSNVGRVGAKRGLVVEMVVNVEIEAPVRWLVLCQEEGASIHRWVSPLSVRATPGSWAPNDAVEESTSQPPRGK